MIEEVLQHLIGVVGVHVHLELRHLAHAQLAVAHGGEELKRGILVQGIGIHEELVAVAVPGALPVVHLLDLHLGVRPPGEGHLVDHGAGAPEQRRGEGVEEDGEPETAGVHHTMLLEHRQKVGRALHRGVGLGHDGVQGVGQGQFLLSCVFGGGCRIAQHREDRAFHRLAHGLEGHLAGAIEGAGDGLDVELVEALAALA